VTYAEFLAVFLLPPIAAFGLIALRRRAITRRTVWTLLGGIALALSYTTPWDNLIVLNGVWTYPAGKVVGIVFGVVPLEEYVFFVLQTLATGFFTVVLLSRGRG
jgi:hypothetical protein